MTDQRCERMSSLGLLTVVWGRSYLQEQGQLKGSCITQSQLSMRADSQSWNHDVLWGLSTPQPLLTASIALGKAGSGISGRFQGLPKT